MRVVFFNNVSGVSTALSKSLQKMNIDSNVFVDRIHHYGYPDEKLVQRFAGRFYNWLHEVIFADILHYHERFFIRPPSKVIRRFEINVPHYARKKVVFHFHGSELRKEKKRERFYPFLNYPMIVAMPDLLKHAPSHAKWFPHPVDTQFFVPGKEELGKAVVGFYKPHDKYPALFTGAETIVKGVEELRSSGKSIDVKEAYLIPWKEMPNYYNTINIWVDKTGLEFYGVSAVEAASSGLPVITEIGEDALTLVPDCPFINVPRSKIKGAIEYLSEENVRKYYGQKCRDYAQRLHDSDKVAERLLKFYRDL
jgi:glycosyltransferase involved in cell wall biosynthesis